MTVTPKKRLGQHFLADENVLGVIGRLAELAPEDVVLEIGPGLGVLTRYLADRFFARPSTKAYGAVSVLVQLATERTGLHPVSRDVFRPRPNVDSALVGFRRIAPGATPRVKKVVEAAFGHRRKTLANAVALAGVASREQAVEALALIGRDANVRAEALAPREFVALTDALWA